jgi:sigma-54 dependent transcriptional regulator, acetoin dehydrogenase operon transcriptional activator AcoR
MYNQIKKERKMKSTIKDLTSAMDLLKCFDYVDESINIIDRQGNFVYSNKKLGELFHLPHESIIGHNVQDIYNVKSLKLFDVMETGVPVVDYILTGDLPNGKHAEVINSIYPIYDEHNKIIGVCDIFRSYKRSLSAARKIYGFQASYTFSDIISQSKGMQTTIATAKEYATTSKNVLIVGESGTGKELFAQAIHNYSLRCDGPFIAVNCASFPSDLIDSELFGYESGSFTGARKEGSIGKFQLAEGGTLFLDEIAEMPITLQAKLLRVTETKVITKIGGQNEIPVDVRIIAATNRDMNTQVTLNEFRGDLYYRLSTLTLSIPSLRTRTEDISTLSNFFLQRSSDSSAGNGIITLSKDALNTLMKYEWPGNVRELENVIYRLSLQCKTGIIGKESVVEHLGPSYSSHSKSSAIKHFTRLDPDIVVTTLYANKGNKKKTAEQLGISRRTVYRMLEKQDSK